MASITRWQIPIKYLDALYGGIKLVAVRDDAPPFALVVNAGCYRPGYPTLFEESVFKASMWPDKMHCFGDDINAKSMDCLDIEAPGAIQEDLTIELLPPIEFPDQSPVVVTLKPRVILWPFIEYE